MSKNGKIHRVWAFLRHRLTAWNTMGEGIHSPYLFSLVRFVLRDKNAYYCFSDIERRRAQLIANEEEIEVVDYGSSGAPDGKPIRRKVSGIARTHLESPEVGQMLFRLVNYCAQESKRPLDILELGTSLGITTAYLASVDTRNRVMTMEGSKALLDIAQEVWRALQIRNIETATGNIDDILSSRAHTHLDIVYIDANHTYAATKRYADILLERMDPKGVMVIDDIHYSEEMEHAWEALKTDKRVTSSMDLYHCGLLFVDPCYWKRHYIIAL